MWKGFIKLILSKTFIFVTNSGLKIYLVACRGPKKAHKLSVAGNEFAFELKQDVAVLTLSH